MEEVFYAEFKIKFKYDIKLKFDISYGAILLPNYLCRWMKHADEPELSSLGVEHRMVGSPNKSCHHNNYKKCCLAQVIWLSTSLDAIE